MIHKCKLCGKRPEIHAEYGYESRRIGYVLQCCNGGIVMYGIKKKKLIDNWNMIMEMLICM